MLKKQTLVLILQIIFGLLFISSGILKLLDIDKFSEAIANFKILSPALIEIVKYIIPISELTLGLFIIFNFKSGLPSFISSLMLSLFTALIVIKVFEGEEISCGCFGALSRDKLDLISVIRNLFLISLALMIATYYENIKIRNQENNINPRTAAFSMNNSKFIKVFLIVNIFFFLSVQNLIFALQNQGLKSRLALLISDHDILKSDDSVTSFTVNTFKNTKLNIDFDPGLKKNTLIFLLKPTCSPCKLNLTNWNFLFKSIDQNSTRILPISLDERENTLQYILDNSISIPIYFTRDEDFILNFKAFLTPQTILISNKGIVKQVWKGILDKDIVNKIINDLS